MYALPLEHVFKLMEFTAHQTLLEEGKLVEIQPGMSVIFVSHQWAGYNHPDQEGKQLACLSNSGVQVRQYSTSETNPPALGGVRTWPWTVWSE